MKFVKEGALPNIEKLMKKGVFCENALPTYPTLTPTNWTTIVTGATPGTHGITDFTVHHVGETLDKTHVGFNSEENSAEYIWNSAARAGKRSVACEVYGIVATEARQRSADRRVRSELRTSHLPGPALCVEGYPEGKGRDHRRRLGG